MTSSSVFQMSSTAWRQLTTALSKCTRIWSMFPSVWICVSTGCSMYMTRKFLLFLIEIQLLNEIQSYKICNFLKCIFLLFSYSCPHFSPCCSPLPLPTPAPKDNPHPVVFDHGSFVHIPCLIFPLLHPVIPLLPPLFSLSVYFQILYPVEIYMLIVENEWLSK